MLKLLRPWLVALPLAGLLLAAPAASSAPSANGDGAAAAAAHWTAERRAEAVPRDIVLDARGLSYLRSARGLLPYGHDVAPRVHAAQAAPGAPAPAAKPGGTTDTTPPRISALDPAAGSTIGSAYTFRATVTDPETGVKSVSFTLRHPDGRTQSYTAARGANDVWTVAFSGFWNGSWSWQVVAKDNGAKGGNTATSAQTGFTVNTGGGGGGGGGGGSTVTNAPWTAGGAVQKAAGRIYFELPSNKSQTSWTGYVCSGSVVSDSGATVSLILTAAHCVYDDANKAFARNVLFIPDQAGTTGSGTDRNCGNDPLGCWAPSFGVVDSDWSTRTWPNNIPWDYAFYVVPTSGAHTGAASPSDSLETSTGTLPISFSAPQTGAGAYTHALGYSYSDDPNFMYCAQDMTTEGASNWWLAQCGLSGGASGGPWIQPLSGGTGPVISVNSWGYTNSPGMAGPKLSGSSASCLYQAAQSGTGTNGGLVPTGC